MFLIFEKQDGTKIIVNPANVECVTDKKDYREISIGHALTRVKESFETIALALGAK